MSDRLKYKLAIGSNNDFVLNANQENKANMLTNNTSRKLRGPQGQWSLKQILTKSELLLVTPYQQ